MSDPRTDEIAREAARLIETGRADDVSQAIHIAAHALGFHGVAFPGHGRVRKHAQAMSMQAMGEAAYLEKRRRILAIAEEMMSTLEHAVPEAETLLAGRAAEGHFDAGVTIHIRVYAHLPLRKIVQALVDLGYAEPKFATMESRFGRLDQARFVEEDFEIALTRCQLTIPGSRGDDLVTGKPISTCNLAKLRTIIAEPMPDVSSPTPSPSPEKADG